MRRAHNPEDFSMIRNLGQKTSMEMKLVQEALLRRRGMRQGQLLLVLEQGNRCAGLTERRANVTTPWLCMLRCRGKAFHMGRRLS
jgi:hypothetical protein